MIKKELTTKKAVEEALKDVREAMMENISASRAQVNAILRKRKARYALLKAKERLTNIEREFLTL